MSGIGPRQVKIVVLGFAGVGKSSLSIKAVTGNFPDEYEPTIEDTWRFDARVSGEHVCLSVLDTAGAEENHALMDNWIQDGDAFLVVYAINAANTYDRLSYFIDKIKRINSDKEIKPPIMVFGNKNDLESERKIEAIKAQRWADPNGLIFREGSAKTDNNVDTIFHDICAEIIKLRPQTAEKKKKRRFCTIL